MSFPTIVPETVEIRRNRLLGLIAGVAAIAAAITWALTAHTIGATKQQGLRTAAPVVPSAAQPNSPALNTPQGSLLKSMTAVCSVAMCATNKALSATLGLSSQASTFSEREQDLLRSMTAVCSVVACQPNERLAVRLGYTPHR